MVERTTRTAEEWRARFSPARVGDESWGYAFADGMVLHDPDGVVAELVAVVAEVHAAYRVPPEIVEHYVWLWENVTPKLRVGARRRRPDRDRDGLSR